MDPKNIEFVANALYEDESYTYYNEEDLRQDALLWLCEPENQDKLDELGIANDKIQVLKFVKAIIRYKNFNRSRDSQRRVFQDIDADVSFTDYVSTFYNCENDAACLKFDNSRELYETLEELNEKDLELLAQLLTTDDYDKIAELQNVNYNTVKMRICRLRQKFKSIYDKKLQKLY